MNIKFSHKYRKLMNDNTSGFCEKVKLLDVVNINLNILSKEFIKYDTDDGLFKLPEKGDYMMLIFLKDGLSVGHDIFTTLRRRTPDKENYYRSAIGQWLDVVFV